MPYVTCWTPYKTGNTKMWNEYASDNGVCIVSTVRQIFMLSRINGARMYKVHYLDENEQMGNMDVPFTFHMMMNELDLACRVPHVFFMQ